MAWNPALSRIWHLKPNDLLDMTPLQLEALKDDTPTPII